MLSDTQFLQLNERRSREHSLKQALEKWDVLSDQFRDKGCTETSNEDVLLPKIVNFINWISQLSLLSSLQVSRTDQYTFKCSEAEVIVTLRTQLVEAKVEK